MDTVYLFLCIYQAHPERHEKGHDHRGLECRRWHQSPKLLGREKLEVFHGAEPCGSGL